MTDKPDIIEPPHKRDAELTKVDGYLSTPGIIGIVKELQALENCDACGGTGLQKGQDFIDDECWKCDGGAKEEELILNYGRAIAQALLIAVEMLQKETEHHSERCSCFLCSTLSRIRSL